MARRNTYDIFSGKELEVAELIQQRRLQMLVHSCLYYELDMNLISDKQWSEWAVELVHLQEQYPDISKQVIWADEFKDWDGTTGAFLPLHDEWVMQKARKLITLPEKRNTKIEVKVKPERKVQSKSKAKTLF